MPVSGCTYRATRTSGSPVRRALTGALGLITIVAATTFVAGPAVAAVDSDAFCAAYATLQEDPTNSKVIRKQAARMAKAKPPKDVVKALGVIKAAASGSIAATDERVPDATSTLAGYVGEECTSSGDTGGAATSTRLCPLTEQQVSTAVGTPLVAAGACTFFPADKAFPNVVFVRQVAFACNGSNPAETGYTEPLDGLGVKAFAQSGTGSGTSILVCTKDPFEVSVDIPLDAAGALAAARQLATEVLNGS